MKKSFVKVFTGVMLLLLMTVVMCFGAGALTGGFVEGPTMEEFHENIEQYVDYDVVDGKAIINNVNIEGYLMWDITIPSNLGGYPVTELSDGCFSDCTLAYILIPETVTKIGNLFSGGGSCTGYVVDENNLCYSNDIISESFFISGGVAVDVSGGALFNKDKSVLIKYPLGYEFNESYVIPDTVKTIAESAFGKDRFSWGNYGECVLKKITIPDSVTAIEDSAFYCCGKLEAIDLPENLESIGESAFSGCRSIEAIELPAKLKSIGNRAFVGCSKVQKVNIPASVTYIGDNALPSSLTEITVDENNNNYFSDNGTVLYDKEKTKLLKYLSCNNKKTYTLPDTVEIIAGSVFSDCKDIEQIILSKALTEIGASAFNGCTSLKTVEIPDSVTKIEEFAFANCENLKSVTLGKNVEEIGMCAFQNCKSLKEIVIPDKVTLLDYCLFDGCTSLEKVTIGAGVSEMDYVQFGFTVFNDCFNIKQFVVKSGNKHYSTDALGNLYNKDKTEFIRYTTGSSAECFVIPDTVQKIKTEAFQGGNSLRTVVIPVSVKEMWVSVFEMAETKKGALEYIYYKGTAEQWKNVRIGYRNDTLYSARIFHNYNDKALTKPLSITSAQSTTSLRLSWAPVIAADGYRVFLKTATGWKALGNTTNTTVTFNNLKPASKFSFAVMAGKIVNGKVQWAKDFATINTATKTVAPAKIVSAQNSSAIRLSWTKCEGATGYRIYCYQNGEWKIALSTTDKTSHTFTGLKPGAIYTLAVRPYIKNGNSVIWSDYRIYYRAATCPAAPATATASSNGKVILRWSAVNGADAYQLFFKIGDGEYKLYKNYDEAQTVSFNNLTKGTKITFAVRGATKTDEKWIFGSFNPVSVTVK